MHRSILLALLVIALTACSRQKQAELHSSGSIHGLITAELAPGDEIALPDIIVILIADEAGRKNLVTAKTDADGRFAFPRRPAGVYTVCFEGPGWKKECLSGIRISRGDTYVPNLRLKSDGTTSRLISGRLVFSDGSPCYVVDRFLGVSLIGHVAVNHSALNLPVNEMGQFVFPSGFSSVEIEGKCGQRSTYASVPAGNRTTSAELKFKDTPPKIDALNLIRRSPADASGDFTLKAKPHLPAGKLQYSWYAPEGMVLRSQKDAASTWKIPASQGVYPIYLVGADEKGAVAVQTFHLDVNAAGSPALVSSLGISKTQPLALPAGYFLSFKQNDENTAKRYYATIDPRNLRLSLGQWWLVNGFDKNGGGGTRAAYLNDNDLGFGRDMHCIEKPSGDVACYVTNYGDFHQNGGSATLAWQADRNQALATVAMEYSAIEGAEGVGKIVKFYVFNGGNTNGARRLSVSLDANGEKYVPGLCVVCHGGTYAPDSSPAINPADADLGSSFREFDLATFKYPNEAPRSLQEPSFKRLNEIVTDTKPALAISDLIHGWYASGDTQNNDFVPSEWIGDAQVKLYKDVVARSCRTCHVALESSYSNSVMSWASYSQFQAEKGRIQSFACGRNKFMPHAFVTFSNFWLRDDKKGPTTLASFKDTGWETPFGDCK